MSAPALHQQRGAALGPPLLTVHHIVKLTDAASELFRTLYDLERAQKQAAKARLAAVLAHLDFFAPSTHYINHEDYIPEGDAS